LHWSALRATTRSAAATIRFSAARGRVGVDTLIGGNGDDVYVVDTSDVVTELVNGGEDSLIGTKTSLALTPAIENLFYTGTTGASLVGNALDNTIGGGIGADSISTGDGNDWLYGGNSAGIDYSLVASWAGTSRSWSAIRPRIR
jgi:Ca2+-binding RTX toxin-like protein